MMNLGQMLATLGVQLANQLTDQQLTALINAAEIEEIETKAWARLQTDFNFNSIPIYSAGTVTVTNGSPLVVGLETFWTTAMVGRVMRVGTNIPNVSSFDATQDVDTEPDFDEIGAGPGSVFSQQLEPINITAVNPNTQTITLQTPFPLANGTVLGYQIFPQFYSIQGMQRVLGVRQLIPLGRTTHDYISRVDPYLNQSSSPATYWAPFGTDEKNNAKIQLWPTEVAQNPYRVYGLKDHIDLQNPDDLPLIPSAVLVNLAATKACEGLLSLRGDQRWAAQRDYFAGRHQYWRDASLDADRELYGVPSQVGDSFGDPNYGNYNPGLDAIYNRDIFGY